MDLLVLITAFLWAYQLMPSVEALFEEGGLLHASWLEEVLVLGQWAGQPEPLINSLWIFVAVAPIALILLGLTGNHSSLLHLSRMHIILSSLISPLIGLSAVTLVLFGASKVAGDVVAQEYGRYFGMKVGIFRGGCLTGPSHASVELHGFLSYLVKVAVHRRPYTIYGYKGKQVRDNIHSYDVIQAFEAFTRNPRPGEVYNLGGGRDNSVSVLEAIDLVEQASGEKIHYTYDERNRIGDHICYISNLNKLRSHFPDWNITISLPEMIEQMVIAECQGRVLTR